MLRRRRASEPAAPAWRLRFDQARQLIMSQRPPAWIESQLGELERALLAIDDDRARLGAALSGLDLHRSADDLKAALRSADPSPAHQELVASLRDRYETLHGLHNRHDDLGTAIERALADAELLAARSVGLGPSDEQWRLDRSVARLADDIRALELAHQDVGTIERTS